MVSDLLDQPIQTSGPLKAANSESSSLENFNSIRSGLTSQKRFIRWHYNASNNY